MYNYAVCSSLKHCVFFSECMVDIEEVVLEHPVMNSDLTDPANGATALKHIRQQVQDHLSFLIINSPWGDDILIQQTLNG